jgi:hypothetical protein
LRWFQVAALYESVKGAIYTKILNFFSNHLILAALLTSSSWFYGGHQYFRDGNRTAGFGWQSIGVLLLIAFLINFASSGAWYSVIIALGAIITEIWLIRRNSEKNRKRQHP